MKCDLNNLSKYVERFVGVITITILIFAGQLYGVVAFALQNQPVFEHITSMDGLSHDTVYSIVQDKAGYMWFGTEAGLNRFDGYNIEVYRDMDSDISIGNANCSTLFVDDTNAIWIASWGGGLEVLDQEQRKIKTFKNDPLNPDSISDNNIHSIFQDRNGTFWIGTYKGGLMRFDSETEKFKTYAHSDSEENSISDNRVWWISQDEDGSLLIGTNKGLDKFDPETETFTRYSQIENRVRTMHWDKNNTLWLGTQKGLCRFDTGTGEYEYFLHDNVDPSADVITSIHEDSNGNLWVGTSNGINLFNRETELFTRYIADPKNDNSIGNNDIRIIFEDRSSNIWIGTRGGGVSKIDIKPLKFRNYSNVQSDKITLSDINVTSIFQSSDQILWVGTNNGGLNRFDLTNQTQEYLMNDMTKEENRNILAICEDTSSLWVGSLGGLNRIDKLTGDIITYKSDSKTQGTLSNNTVLSALKDSQGTIWIGTLIGLNQYDANNDRFINYLSDSSNNQSLSSNTVTSLYEDRTGNLWVGTQSGLNLLDRENGLFTQFVYENNNKHSISDNIIHSIFEDSAQNLWIGTQYGLNLFDRETRTFKSFYTKNGLPNNCIRSIQEDATGRLWISTNKGISCFDPIADTFSNYDYFDGLQGNNYNSNSCVTTNTGDILFGGTKGLDFINPEVVFKNNFKPPIVITSFRVMNDEYDFSKALQSSGKVSLSYAERNIGVQFASLDYTNVQRNNYAYMLDGFDKKWHYLGTKNSFDYTNIPSGNYVLRIKGTNSDGIWNDEGISLNISMAPPWWLSPIAYLSYVFLILLIFFLIILYIQTKNKKRNLQLNEMLRKTINAMSTICELKDVYTTGHQRRVTELSCAIASEMKLPKETINNLYFGSLIHDIGKTNIALEILNKPGKISELEFQLIQTHVEQGHEVIKKIDFPWQISTMVLQHHERMDGSGYPQKLAGDQIILESRIISVADVVEAMTTDRPYRAALGIDMALDEVLKFKGQKYDASVVDACVKLFREKNFTFSK